MRNLKIDELLARPWLDPMAGFWDYVHLGTEAEHRAAVQMEANARAVIDAAIDREQRRANERRRFNKFLDAAMFDYFAYLEGRPMGGLWWIIEGDEPWAPEP